jgi:RNA polymerase sigma-70 factor (ECF subfamily)
MDKARNMLMGTEATFSARPPSRAEPAPEPALPTFREVFAEHARYVGRTLRYLGVAEADLEDACQEVFVVVHRRLPSFELRSGVRAWVRQICVNVAQNQRRGMRRRREEPLAKPIDVAAPATQQADAERSEQRRKLLALLGELDEAQRAVFVLYEIEGLTMSEVARAVGCPLQTADSRLHAARARVEDALKGPEVEP